MGQRSLARLAGGDGPLNRMGNATIDEIATWHRTIENANERDLLDVYRVAGEIGKRAWLIQAHCLSVAKRRKLHHNDGGVRAVADMFGLSPSQASGLIRVWDTWEEDFLTRDAPADRVIGVSWYKTAAYTDDPDAWLAHIQRRQAENPAYRVEDLRVEIARALKYGDGRPPAPDPALVAARAGMATISQFKRGPRGDAREKRAAEEEAARARAALVVTRYREMIKALETAITDTGEMIIGIDPANMADMLGPIGPDEKFENQLLDQMASWLRRTTQARRQAAGLPATNADAGD